MKLLLDTHYLLWAFLDSQRLSSGLTQALLDETVRVYYSHASLWEIAIKFRLGKLGLAGVSPEEFGRELSASFLRPLPLDDSILLSSHRLPDIHKDPFDRLLVWQAIQTDCLFVSSDARIRDYEGAGLKLFPEPGA